MIDTLLSLVAPHLCISCGDIGTVLCSNCKYDIVSEIKHFCLFCNRAHPDSENTTCSSTWFVGERKAALQRLIGSYKFNGMRAADHTLVNLLLASAPPFSADAVVTWIPTNSKHVRERGYDHMARLATLFAKRKNLRARPLLMRKLNFVQHRSDRRTRMTQVIDAFAVAVQLRSDTTYILLDDIYTTGATVREAARTLKIAGAGEVVVGVIARQSLD